MPEGLFQVGAGWMYRAYSRYRDRYIVGVDPVSDVPDGAIVVFDTETGQMVGQVRPPFERSYGGHLDFLLYGEEGHGTVTYEGSEDLPYDRAGTDVEGNDIFAPLPSKLEEGEYIWFASDTYIEITTTPPKDGETRGEYMGYRYIGSPPRWWMVAVDREAMTERYVSKYDGYYTTTTIHEIIQASEIGWAEVRASDAVCAPVEDAEGYIHSTVEGNSLEEGRFGMYYGNITHPRYDNERFGASHP